MAVSESTINGWLQYFVDMFETQLVQGQGTFLTKWTTAHDALAGFNKVTLASRLRSARSALIGFFGWAALALGDVILEYGPSALGLGPREAAAFDRVWDEWYRYYITNSKRIQSRGLTFSTPVAGGSNVGNGDMIRLVVDEWGQVLEAVTAETKVARCRASGVTSAQRHKAVFLLHGAVAGNDILEEAGSWTKEKETTIASHSAADSAKNGVNNPSFSSSPTGAATATPSEITGWTVGTATPSTDFELVTGTAGTEYYRDYEGDGLKLALLTKVATWSLTQDLTANGLRLDSNRPMMAQLAVRRVSTATGTITLQVGSQSASLDVSTLASGAWGLLRLTLNSGLWAKNLRTNAAAPISVTISRSGGGSGNVTIDDFTFDYLDQVDGHWWWTTSGSTDFAVEDTFSIATTATVNAKIQQWLRRAFGRSMPSCPVVPTAAPTAALAGGGAGNVDNGSHTYTKTFVDVNGVESGESATAAVTVTDKTVNGKVTVGRNESSPGAHIAYWRIYRSQAGTATPRNLLATVAIGTSSYTDNIADATIVAAATPPAGVTLADP